MKILTFTLDEPRYALYLSIVERVIHAVEITPLPKAPEIVPGIINVHGEILPVIDIRKRFNLPFRERMIEDVFIIAGTDKRKVVLVADAVSSITEVDEEDIRTAQTNISFAENIKGVVKLEKGLFLICDMDMFLSLDEESRLSSALSGKTK